jgi:hypothetical protein
MLGQWLHQAILRKHIERFGVTVETGSKLISLEQDDAGAQVRIEKTDGSQVSVNSASFAYVIGADGAKGASSHTSLFLKLNNHSEGVVRKALGLEFKGETRDDARIFTIDLSVSGMNGEEVRVILGTERGLFTYLYMYRDFSRGAIRRHQRMSYFSVFIVYAHFTHKGSLCQRDREEPIDTLCFLRVQKSTMRNSELTLWKAPGMSFYGSHRALT